MEIEGCVQMCRHFAANALESTPMTPCEVAHTNRY